VERHGGASCDAAAPGSYDKARSLAQLAITPAKPARRGVLESLQMQRAIVIGRRWWRSS
jgi:hypothetical protein